MLAVFIDADNFTSPTLIKEAFEVLERMEGSITVRRAYESAERSRPATARYPAGVRIKDPACGGGRSGDRTFQSAAQVHRLARTADGRAH